ncbi:MAG: CoA transferase [Nitrospinota bacterium]|nr:MAG: CoA transferase [Nitrospinota bacterium]
MEAQTERLPLSGIRVLDIGTLIGGPFGASLLAEFGAEVIKVEQPGVGDPMRTLGGVYQGVGLYWLEFARNKKSITLNLREKEGQELLKRLVKVSDVLIENFRPGTLERWNLGYEELHALNPRLILARVSGFGQTGPYRDRYAFDRIATAFGGLTYVTGFPETPPVRPGFNVADYMAGIFNALAVMMALYHRDARQTGEGQVIDLALYEPIFRISALVQAYDKLGRVRERTGNVNPHIAPAETFQTRDGQWIVLIAGTDNIWRRLARAMGREELADDPRYATMTKRVEHMEELHRLIGEWVQTYNAEEVSQILEAAGVPATRMYSIADIFADPHYQARENLVEVETPQLGKIKMSGVIPKFSRTPGRIRWAGPDLGAHNEEIYQGLLGLSAETLAEYKSRGII